MRIFLVMRTACIYSILITNFTILADTITVYNKSHVPLFIAPYYIRNGTAERVISPLLIEPDNVLSLERTKRKLWYDRILIFDKSDQRLQEILTQEELAVLPSINIGLLQGKIFYLTYVNADLVGYNASKWSLVQPIIAVPAKTKEQIERIVKRTQQELLQLKNQLTDVIKKRLPAVKQNIYAQQQATVRIGNNLPTGEQQYLNKRMPKVKRALELLLDRNLDDHYIPKIAIIGSGGGYRAMFGTLGHLIAAETMGLLDSATYITALSGSTWCLGPWISSGISLQDFKDQLIKIVSSNKGLHNFNGHRAQLIADMLLTKFIFNQPITLVDFYGALLGNALLEPFGDQRQLVHLADQSEYVQDASVPFPIYTAIRVDKQAPSQWYEFTPFEVGGAWLARYVPTWAFGRRFEKGKSIDFAPPQSLGFFLGIYGSAFAVTFNRAYQELADMIHFGIIKEIIEKLLFIAGELRLSTGKVFNFTYDMPGSPLSNYKIIKMADAGIDFNLPYPPVSGQRPGRKMDILIFLDSSGLIETSSELRATEQYARYHHLAFPQIDYTVTAKQIISIFKDEQDTAVPVVIYLPLIKDATLWQNYKTKTKSYDSYKQLLDNFDPRTCVETDFCSTFNFSYDPLQAQQLIAQTEFNMTQSRKRIIKVINWVIDNKSKGTKK